MHGGGAVAADEAFVLAGEVFELPVGIEGVRDVGVDRVLKVVQAVGLLVAGGGGVVERGVGFAVEGLAEGVAAGLAHHVDEGIFPGASTAAAGVERGGLRGHEVVVGGGIHLIGLGELHEVVDAGGRGRAVSGALKSGQEHGGQDRNDADDDQQLNQGESLFAVFHFGHAFQVVCFWFMLSLFFVCDSRGSPETENAAVYILYRISREMQIPFRQKIRKKPAVFEKKAVLPGPETVSHPRKIISPCRGRI